MSPNRSSDIRWVLVAMGIVLVCAIAAGNWMVSALRMSVATGWVVGAAAQFRHPGPKWRGAVSLACAVVFNLFIFFPLVCDAESGGVESSIAGALIAVLLGNWIGLGVLAVRVGPSPDRTLGALSFLALLSPGILLFLDWCQFVALTYAGREWWHVRPFNRLVELLWSSNP